MQPALYFQISLALGAVTQINAHEIFRTNINWRRCVYRHDAIARKISAREVWGDAGKIQTQAPAASRIPPAKSAFSN